MLRHEDKKTFEGLGINGISYPTASEIHKIEFGKIQILPNNLRHSFYSYSKSG